MVQFLRLAVLRIGNFIAQYHSAIIAYIVSSFLAQYVGVGNVGYVFVVSSVITMLVLYAAPAIFRSFGTRNVITVLTVTEIAILLGMAMTVSLVPAIILATLQSIVASAIFVGIDLLIEAETKTESVTGWQRTSYLTVTNAAFLLGALSISLVVVGDQYWRAFVTSALVLLPFLGLSVWFLPRVSFAEVVPSIRGSVVEALRTDRSLRSIVLAHLMLQIFFSWAGIYIPILLFAYEGFTWAEIGVITAIAMLPYIALEFPFGVIADTWLGEKEILAVGFGIIAVSLFGMFLLVGASFWWWVGVMVLSRVGGAAVESMTEVHFFRRVSERDTGTITFFRALKPLGSVAGPLLASVALMTLSLPASFVVFGAFMILGIPVALSIVDTK